MSFWWGGAAAPSKVLNVLGCGPSSRIPGHNKYLQMAMEITSYTRLLKGCEEKVLGDGEQSCRRVGCEEQVGGRFVHMWVVVMGPEVVITQWLFRRRRQSPFLDGGRYGSSGKLETFTWYMVTTTTAHGAIIIRTRDLWVGWMAGKGFFMNM